MKKKPIGIRAEKPTIRREKKQAPVEDTGIPVISIGASAGGLETLETFLSNVPPGPNPAFVIIQHLDPKHKSIMDSLLKRYTQMGVVEMEDGMAIKPDTVYVNPPDRYVRVEKNILRLEPFSRSERGANLPIDFFLRSVAQDQGERAIGVILSGTGSDGTQGIRAIKEVGGMVMVQEEASAKYPGMPGSAIQTGLVDFVLPVDKMPEQLLKYLRHPYLGVKEVAQPTGGDSQTCMQKILSIVRLKTGHDFSQYKPSTIQRRIERRMAIHQLDKLQDYCSLIEHKPQEAEILFKDFLISVTRFFRDPDAFHALEKTALPELLSQKEPGAPVRIWVPGCSTGEEAYSLAIIVIEAMEKLKTHFPLQIFASDIDQDAIEAARNGVYPESITADVTKERLRRFFTKEANIYYVNKQIRECVTFAHQDIVKDPPFSKIDLISCRNILIYMEQTLQKRIFPLFHYALNTAGVLFLGTSETIGDLTYLFSPIDTRWKIYKRIGLSRGIADYPRFQGFPTTVHRREFSPSAGPAIRVLGEKVIEKFAPPAVLVNDKYEVLYLYGQVDRYLALSSGEITCNLPDIVREGLRSKLNSALAEAFKSNTAGRCENLRVRTSEGNRIVTVIVQPVASQSPAQKLMIIIFKEQENERGGKGKGAIAAPINETEIDAIRQELALTREHLQTTIEELQSSNEELNSTNEELQSTNEELETSKEELQSTNEELVTVNSELQHKVDELLVTRDDVNNLLASTEIASIFLNTELKIKHFTPAALKIFNLLPTDIGRPVYDITSNISSFDIRKAAGEVLSSLTPRSIEVQAGNKNYYTVRILPYRTLDNAIDGVVVSFIDITELKRISQQLDEARIIAIVGTMREPFVILDGDLNVHSANDAFFKLFKVKAIDTLRQPVYALGNGQWNAPKLRTLLERVIPRSTVLTDYRIEHDFPRIGLKTILLNARRIPQTKFIFLAMEDITGSKGSKAH